MLTKIINVFALLTCAALVIFWGLGAYLAFEAGAIAVGLFCVAVICGFIGFVVAEIRGKT